MNNIAPLILTLFLPSGCSVMPEVDAGANFAAFLPQPLNEDWQRTPPATGPADQQLFGGGMSTVAEYINDLEGCSLRITITGNAPMMQNLSMNFSNPAAAGLTGARLAYAGEEPIVVTTDGEVQTLTGNYLTQYAGDCDYQSKLAYVEAMPLDELRDFELKPEGVQQSARLESMPGVVWAATFGGSAKDWAYAMTATYDGGVCTAGRTASEGAGLEDVWIVRVDKDGNRLWSRSFGGPAIDRGRAIVETADRGFAIAGATESASAGEFDVWVIKTDADGNRLWDRRFGGAATDWASSIVVTHDGGLALGAYTQDESGGPYDFWVIKLDGDGMVLWQRRYGGDATDWSNAITETEDHGLVIVGHTESKGAGGADFWVLKLSEDGEPLWDKTFGGAHTDYASTVTATRDGGVIIGGMTQPEARGGFDSRIIRLDESGDLVWEQTLGGAGNDWVRSIVETKNGSVAIGGYTDSKGAGLNDVWLIKLSGDGSPLSEHTYGEAGNEWARALVELPDGALALAGDTYSRGAGAGDVLVLKVTGSD